MFDGATGSFVLRQAAAARCPRGRRGRPRIEDALGHVHARQRRRVLLRELATQDQQTAGVIGVIVRDHEIGDGGQSTFVSAFWSTVSAARRCRRKATAIHFEHGGKAPLADARRGVADEHRGEDRHLDLFRGLSGGGWDAPGMNGEMTSAARRVAGRACRVMAPLNLPCTR